MIDDSTIYAIATPPGNGAIAIIRLSGENAIMVADSFFQTISSTKRLVDQKKPSIHFGYISYKGEYLDEVLISIFRAPHSYTGEDIVEISCHGSMFIQQKIIQLLSENGIRLAKPGEFTMRAFMNGKMDLSQAEAVADLIASETEASHRLAASQLRGGFSAEISKLRNELLQFASLIELELDFSEEDVLFADRLALTQKIESIKDLVDSLAGSFRLGNAIKNGIPVVIAGRPNVGKSSLLNALLKEERAIVSSIPGTTRDYIEESVHIGGLLFRFIDTAGLRESDDTIESMGIERTLRKIDEAEIIIALVEATDSADYIEQFVGTIKEKSAGRAKILIIANKSDLAEPSPLKNVKETLFAKTGYDILMVSATTNSGIEELKKLLLKSIDTGGLSSPQLIVTNARHFEALSNVSESLERVLDGFRNGIPTELISTDIRQAIYHLGEITGQITSDEILGNIFKNFCIGK